MPNSSTFCADALSDFVAGLLAYTCVEVRAQTTYNWIHIVEIIQFCRFLAPARSRPGVRRLNLIEQIYLLYWQTLVHRVRPYATSRAPAAPARAQTG